MDRDKRIWYLSPMRAAKLQTSLCIRAVSPEPLLLAHTSSESRGTFRQKARSLAPLNGWACAFKICHDGMLEDTNSLDRAHLEVSVGITQKQRQFKYCSPNEPPHDKTNKMACVPTQRRLRLAYLIRDFAVRMKKAYVLSYPLSAQLRLIRLGGCQADLSLRWVHMTFCWFCRVAAQIHQIWGKHFYIQ